MNHSGNSLCELLATTTSLITAPLRVDPLTALGLLDLPLSPELESWNLAPGPSRGALMRVYSRARHPTSRGPDNHRFRYSHDRFSSAHLRAGAPNVHLPVQAPTDLRDATQSELIPIRDRRSIGASSSAADLAGDSVKLTIGWALSGPAFVDDSQADARVGQPTWGPAELLRDLELRLALPGETISDGLRTAKYRARIERAADANAFYAKSLGVDPIGTAQTLLAWRDGLIEAGWDGAPVPGGGARLTALTAIEAVATEPLPRGLPDRLVRVEDALTARVARTRLYDEIALVENRSLWSTRWRRIFAKLEAAGTPFTAAEQCWPGAATGSDLARLQCSMRGETSSKAEVHGDGSLLLLRGETPDETAELTAALLRSLRDDALVIRCLDPAPLEAALIRQGLPSQGHVGKSAWRPAMQVLPLALELAFEPRDPHRVLELLTLPVGPFRGKVGAQLARAVAKQPGIGGQEWKRRKARLAEALREDEANRRRAAGESDVDAAAESYVTERLRRLGEWLETSGANAEGATRQELVDLARRVCDWLARGLAGQPEVYGAAYAQAKDFTEALSHDTRNVFSRESARQLLDDVVSAEHGHALSLEQAGRIAHVAHPSAILAPVGTLLAWGFVSASEPRPTALPWNSGELAALAHAGTRFTDPEKLLANEADAWRRAVLAARDRVVLVVPNRAAGRPLMPHSLWHEIAARLDLDEIQISRLTRTAQGVLHGTAEATLEVEALAPLPLPMVRAAWALPDPLHASETESQAASAATSIETLASCPLAWVLKRAEIARGMLEKVPEGPLLNGGLGHRLVEELFRDGSFEREEDAFLERAQVLLQELVRTEAANLLLPGAASERTQLMRQLTVGVRALHRYLTQTGFRIAAVEEELETDSVIGKISARLDLRLVDRNGDAAVLDLKWGASSYGMKLDHGLAVQLAAYSRALGTRGTATATATATTPPPAAYFALRSGKVLSSDPRMFPHKLSTGPSLERTWERLEHTLRAVRASLAQGRVLVGGARSTPRLLDALGVSEAEQPDYLAIDKDETCRYCQYASLCGKAWEAFQ